MDSERKKNNIFITGASGFVGKFLVKKILEITDKNLILNCRNSDNWEFHSNRIIYSSLNLLDTTSIEEVVHKYLPETIIHLAAIARVGDGEKNPDIAFQTNVLATKQLIKSAISNKVKNFVFVSSDLARPPLSVIGITKFLTEAFIQESTIPVFRQTIVRLPNVSYSPGTVHLIFERQIKEGKPLTITHPQMTRRFINGEEAANFILFALNNGMNKDIFVVDKEPEKIVSLAQNLISKSGKQLAVETIGIRAGEKLEEETYKVDELTTTAQKNLSLLLNKPFSNSKINEVKQYLVLKPGFTMKQELELL